MTGCYNFKFIAFVPIFFFHINIYIKNPLDRGIYVSALYMCICILYIWILWHLLKCGPT